MLPEEEKMLPEEMKRRVDLNTEREVDANTEEGEQDGEKQDREEIQGKDGRRTEDNTGEGKLPRDRRKSRGEAGRCREIQETRRGLLHPRRDVRHTAGSSLTNPDFLLQYTMDTWLNQPTSWVSTFDREALDKGAGSEWKSPEPPLQCPSGTNEGKILTRLGERVDVAGRKEDVSGETKRRTDLNTEREEEANTEEGEQDGEKQAERRFRGEMDKN
ncbi:hypothetical protein NDU88_004065 [Pleurodeles waltl]|uniref:Uncharacterized protein n=1 Tax=Pleurodeles waltl TaxID=8319 RepID=A0AAV7QAT2_PLEWA|nr:hypothetical protein NDU88_004065 [Pleurodeles waltl]